MTRRTPYSDEVRRRLAEAVRAGDLPGAPPPGRRDGRADGSNPACGDVISVAVRVAGGRVEAARWRAHGCPHLLAAAEAACEAAEGRPVGEAAAFGAGDLEAVLGGPAAVGSTGRHAVELAADVVAEAVRRAAGGGSA
jgi:NifU-like protein involved in Fe-S cluster formation